MKLAMGGLLTAAGATLGTTAYLANRFSNTLREEAQGIVRTILTSNLNLSGLKVTVHLEKLPKIPFSAQIDGLHFSLNDALNPDVIELVTQIPGLVSLACKTFAWWEGAKFGLAILAIGGVGIYAYHNFDKLKQTYDINLEKLKRLLPSEDEQKREDSDLDLEKANGSYLPRCC